MKTKMIWILGMALLAAPITWANPPAADSTGPMHAGRHKMWDHREGPMGMGPMGMPALGMRGPQMVATNDGGVIVLCGMKLYRYDKNLNLKKTVDLPMPKAMDMKKDCDRDSMEGEHCSWHGHDSDHVAPKPPEKK